MFVYMFGRTYVILHFDPRIFVLVMWSTRSQIVLNRILWFIDQYRITLVPFWILLRVQLRRENLRDFHFYSS